MPSFKLLSRLAIPNLKETLLRFPLPVLGAAAYTAILIFLSHTNGSPDETIARLMCYIVVASIALVSARLFFEAHGRSPKREAITTAVILAALLLMLYMPAMTFDYLVQYMFLLPGVVLSVMVAPYLLREPDETACCQFNSAVGVGVFFAGFASIILAGGVSIALVSIGYLFEVNIAGWVYSDLWILTGCLFAWVYALSAIPLRSDEVRPGAPYPRGISFIISYILAPLLVVYTVILYAYFAKILFQWELPKGNISIMVTLFGGVGVLTHLFSYPLAQEGNLFLKLVRRYFYHALLVPVAMLFLAVQVRVSSYGITEQRYALILIGIWLAVSAGYIVATRRQQFKIMVGLLSALLILASFGPWSASAVSARSQVARLQHILEQEGILKEGKIVKPASLSDAREKEITSIVNYLALGKKYDVIRGWFPADAHINTTPAKEVDQYKIMADMGVSSAAQAGRMAEHRKTNFWIGSGGMNLVETGGYPYVASFQNTYPVGGGEWLRTVRSAKDEYRVKMTDNAVEVTASGGHKTSLDLQPLMEWMRATKQSGNSFPPAEKERLVLEKQGEGFGVRIIIQSLNVQEVESGSLKVSRMDFTLLIRPAGAPAAP